MKISLTKSNIIFLLIFLLAFLVRFFELFNNFDYLTSEPAIDYMTAKELIVNHKIPIEGYAHGGSFTFSKILWNALLAIPFNVSSGHPFSLRIMMFLISISTIPLAYVLFSKILNTKTTLLITFLLASSPLLVEYAGKIAPPFAVPSIIVILMFSNFRLLSAKTNYFYLSVFLIGMVAYFEIPAFVLLLIQFSLLAGLLIHKNLLNTKQVLYGFLIIFTSTIPVFIFSFQDNLKSFAFHGLQYLNLQSLILTHLETFAWNFRASTAPNIIVSLFVFTILVIGSVKILKDKKIKVPLKRFVFYLVTSPVLFFVVTLLYPNVLGGWWLSFLIVYYCVLLGIVFDYLYFKKYKPHVLFLLIILITLFFNRAYKAYGIVVYPHSTDSIRVKSVAEYVLQDSKNASFSYEVLSVHKPAGRAYDYEAMFWWLGKYSLPSNPNQIYYILEPDYKSLSNKEKLNLKNSKLLKELPNGVKVFKKQ